MQDVEAAVKALRTAHDPAQRRGALDSLDQATRKLKERLQ